MGTSSVGGGEGDGVGLAGEAEEVQDGLAVHDGGGGVTHEPGWKEREYM